MTRHLASIDGATSIVNLAALERNARRLATRIPSSTRMLAAVKADGYGHGAVEVASQLRHAGVSWFGVATAEEAHALRKGGITERILVFGPVPEQAVAGLVAQDVDLTVGDLDGVHTVRRALESGSSGHAGTGRVGRVHLKIDTGMGRLGSPDDRAGAVAHAVVTSPLLHLAGTWTHFACADDPRSEVTDRQIASFARLLGQLAREGIDPGIRHASNSAGVLTRPDAAFDMVRPGIALYGHAPSSDLAKVAADLEPVATLIAPVTFVKRVRKGTPVSYGHRFVAPRDTTIATLRVGYADGYPRAATNVGRGTWVPRDGERVATDVDHPIRVAGTVCMDQTMVDVGNRAVEPGDVMALWGASASDLTDLATSIGTISYELLVRISPRVARRYVRDEAPFDDLKTPTQD